ncbi:MAG: hypothetical protein JWM83_3384, partial [Candidatus Angelobacter sp.]|nr:hypothetical protein [Candidatus Angelobacter sp.]
MRKQEQLALGVERRALHAPAVPGAADFHAAMSLVDIPVTGHTQNFGGIGISYRKGKHPAFRLALKPAANLGFHLRGIGNYGVPELPQFAIPDGFYQVVMMIRRE